jgi:peptidoglycan/LPS O-acetylase OafA/YrhL
VSTASLKGRAAVARLPHVDLLKAVACQLIVLHHLAFYGPMADVAAALAPAVFAFLADPARMAVQVFLVVGGFLAARSLAPQGVLRGERPWALRLRDRYLRLALPLAAMLVVAVLANAVADRWMDHPSISEPPTVTQFLLHLLLLHDLAGEDALSAGVWYVAIDFQLFALMLLLLHGARALSRWLGGSAAGAPVLVLAAVALSLLVINRWPAWDVGAPYFFGAYGLGALAAWLSGPLARPAAPGAAEAGLGQPTALALLAGATGLVVLALVVDFRARIALAGLTALVLMLGSWAWSETRHNTRLSGAGPRTVQVLSDISYAVFLIHFPVCLLVNAAFHSAAPGEPLWQALGVGVAWAASLVAGWAFHRWVEQPSLRWANT